MGPIFGRGALHLLLFSCLTAMAFSPVTALQVEPSQANFEQLEDRLERVEQRVDRFEDRAGAAGIALLLIGFFCALWAQNTGRSSWLWFFLGLFFHFFALMAVLIKNAAYVRSRER